MQNWSLNGSEKHLQTLHQNFILASRIAKSYYMVTGPQITEFGVPWVPGTSNFEKHHLFADNWKFFKWLIWLLCHQKADKYTMLKIAANWLFNSGEKLFSFNGSPFSDFLITLQSKCNRNILVLGNLMFHNIRHLQMAFQAK